MTAKKIQLWGIDDGDGESPLGTFTSVEFNRGTVLGINREGRPIAIVGDHTGYWEVVRTGKLMRRITAADSTFLNKVKLFAQITPKKWRCISSGDMSEYGYVRFDTKQITVKPPRHGDKYRVVATRDFTHSWKWKLTDGVMSPVIVVSFKEPKTTRRDC